MNPLGPNATRPASEARVCHPDRLVMSTTERFASGAWLTPSLVRLVATLMIAGAVVALGFLFATAHGVLDRFGRPLGTDFAAFWTAGRMALQGHAAETYDWSIQGAFQQQVLGTSLFYPWSYPPVFLVIASALALLPYLPALLFWNVATLSVTLAVFWRILPSRHALLLALGFPAVLVCLGHGQTGFLTAVLLA